MFRLRKRWCPPSLTLPFAFPQNKPFPRRSCRIFCRLPLSPCKEPLRNGLSGRRSQPHRPVPLPPNKSRSKDISSGRRVCGYIFLNCSFFLAAFQASESMLLVVVVLKYGCKCLLRHLYRTELAHTLLSFLLFFQKLFLS